MNRFWSSVVNNLTPYVPGEQPKRAHLVKLNTNENPYAPSPKVVAAIKAEAADTLRLYPDPESTAVRQAVAEYYGLQADQVFVGNGSDEVLAHCFLALLKHDRPILFPDITYSFYPVYCQLYGVSYRTIPLAADFALTLADYYGDNGGIIFPNPNAPTGRSVSLQEIETLLQHNSDSVVVVDEAYVDFGADSAVTLIDAYPQLLVIQTLSKSRALAGLRVGFAMGNSDLIEALQRVKNSFNSYPLDRLVIAGAVAALKDDQHFEQTRRAVIQSRESLVQRLLEFGFEVVPSAANFVFARHPQHDAAKLANQLRDRDIIVRHFRQPRIEQYLRITVGTDAQCTALVDALDEII